MRSDSSQVSTPGAGTNSQDTSIVKVLEYIRSTFSEESVLDSLPLEAAANPGAYHAWRTYRGAALQARQTGPTSPDIATYNDEKRAVESSTLGRNRHPGAWNWEGVWEERVSKAVKASLSEPVLFGSSAGEDIVSVLGHQNLHMLNISRSASVMVMKKLGGK